MRTVTATCLVFLIIGCQSEDQSLVVHPERFDVAEFNRLIKEELARTDFDTDEFNRLIKQELASQEHAPAYFVPPAYYPSQNLCCSDSFYDADDLLRKIEQKQEELMSQLRAMKEEQEWEQQWQQRQWQSDMWQLKNRLGEIEFDRMAETPRFQSFGPFGYQYIDTQGNTRGYTPGVGHY